MGKHEERRFTRFFHTVVAILLLLSGGALLGFGIWLQATGHGKAFDLDFSDTTSIDFALNARIATIILGSFVLVTGVVSLIALGKQCLGKTFRVIYIIMALLILIVLVFITVASILILRNKDSGEVRDVIEEAWKRTVEADSTIVCEIEDTFECRGVANDDCKLCVTGLEDTCDETAKSLCTNCANSTSRDASVGCFDRIVGRLGNIFLPIAIVAGILSAIVLSDIFMTCCL